jgi:hypothetical protein
MGFRIPRVRISFKIRIGVPCVSGASGSDSSDSDINISDGNDSDSSGKQQ